MPVAIFRKGYRHNGLLFIPGDQAEVSEADFDRLAGRGIVTAPGSTAADTAVREPKPPVADKPDADEPTPALPRPAKAAGVDKWRSYAESQGLDVKGLDKAEIIALVS